MPRLAAARTGSLDGCRMTARDKRQAWGVERLVLLVQEQEVAEGRGGRRVNTEARQASLLYGECVLQLHGTVSTQNPD